jgi:hypothetical protein
MPQGPAGGTRRVNRDTPIVRPPVPPGINGRPHPQPNEHGQQDPADNRDPPLIPPGQRLRLRLLRFPVHHRSLRVPQLFDRRKSSRAPVMIRVDMSQIWLPNRRTREETCHARGAELSRRAGSRSAALGAGGRWAGKRKLVLAEQSSARTSLMSRSPVSSIWVPQIDDRMPVIWDDAPGAQIRGVSHSSRAVRGSRVWRRSLRGLRPGHGRRPAEPGRPSAGRTGSPNAAR